MDIPTHAELLARIEAFCARHDMADTRFGREAINNPAFISNLRKEPPVSPTLETLNRLRAFMDGKDAEARTREKLAAEPGAGEPAEEEEIALPFSPAPVNPTGASSPTSSSTSGQPTSSAARDSCRCSTGREPSARSAGSNSPADEASLAARTAKPTEARC